VPWMSQVPASGELAPGDTDTFTVTVDSTGLVAGTTYEATLIVKTDAGRSPNVYIPVQLIVHAEEGGVGVGANTYDRSRWVRDLYGEDVLGSDQQLAHSGSV